MQLPSNIQVQLINAVPWGPETTQYPYIYILWFFNIVTFDRSFDQCAATLVLSATKINTSSLGSRWCSFSSGEILVFPKIMEKPPNHPFVHRVFHYNHPFWGFSPYFWKHPYGLDILEGSPPKLHGVSTWKRWVSKFGENLLFHALIFLAEACLTSASPQ